VEYKFQNSVLCTETHRFLSVFASEFASASLSWQRLQLVLRYINNFNGRVSSIDGRLSKSNIIDNVQFLEEL